MLLFERKKLLLASAGAVILMLLTPTHGCSDAEQSYQMAQPTYGSSNAEQSYQMAQPTYGSSNAEQSYKIVHDLVLTPKKSQQITIHVILLWSSFGFLMPIGVLLIRASSNVKSARNVKLLFHCHVASQVVAAVLASVGAVLSIRDFPNAFNNTHQRVGLALYVSIWLVPLVGFLRPDRGARTRSAWYLAHWLLGFGVCVVGVADVYIGLQTFQVRTGRSTRRWTLLLIVEAAALAFVYLVQDRWSYVVRQKEEDAAAALGDERSEGSTITMYPANDHKDVVVVTRERSPVQITIV